MPKENIDGEPIVNTQSTMNSAAAVTTSPKHADEPHGEDADEQTTKERVPAPPSMSGPSQFPDGGFIAWFCVAGVLLRILLVWLA